MAAPSDAAPAARQDKASADKPSAAAADKASYFPWSAVRSATPSGLAGGAPEEGGAESETPLKKAEGDHAISHTRGFARRVYPVDCPALAVRWYHAVDVSKQPKKKHALSGAGGFFER
jgi:hypothetical protein